MIIERVALPWIGVSHTATTGRRQRVGVSTHLTGRRDLVVYDPDDPERAAYAVVLDPVEAEHLAGLLAVAVTVSPKRPLSDPGPRGLERLDRELA